MSHNIFKWFVIPLLLISLGMVITIYVVNNPTDSLVARALTYEKVLRALREHMGLLLVSMSGAIVVGITGGIMLSRPGFYYVGRVVENVVNIGQTVPSLAILALFYAGLGLGFNTAVFALFLYSILPILRNTYAGIRNVEPNIIEAARGMGMHPMRILTQIELPIAYPIITAGIRTAIVINVGAATLATFIGGGGVGDIIVTGLSVRRDMVVFAGASLVAITAILLDHIVGQVEAHLVKWS